MQKATLPLTGNQSQLSCFCTSALALMRYFLGLLLLALSLTARAQPTYTTENGTITITGYSGDIGDLTIPASIDGLPVKAIGASAFFNRSNLRSVTIPDSVTSIGKEAFSLCRGLTNVVIPNGVISIGDFAFIYCANLTSVNISSSVTSIGDSSFHECTNLTDFFVATENPSFSSAEGILFNKTQTILIQYPTSKSVTSYAIPNSVTKIGDYAFYSCASLTSMNIPDSVTNIGRYAFYFCTGLTNLTIANSVTTIGDAAFVSCTNLTTVTIPKSVTTLGGGAFLSCTGLATISVDEANPSFSSVGGIMFNKAQTVLIQYPSSREGSSYSIPNSVTNIEGFAFASCTSLAAVTIPNSVITIRHGAFSSCTALMSAIIPNGVTVIEEGVFNSCTALTSITIPNSVTSIRYSAFADCTGLKNVAIPDSVTNIGAFAFSSCASLTNVIIGSRVTTIEDGALWYCTALKSVSIPNSVTSIGSSAFQHCTGLVNVMIGSSVTNIGDQAFFLCASLTAVSVDEANSSFKSLGGVLFNKAQTLLIQFPISKEGASYVIPSTVSFIERDAFYGCNSLTNVTIPKSVLIIDQYVLSGCLNLKGVYFEGNSPFPFPDEFWGPVQPTIYYLTGTKGWESTFGGLPTVLWNPTAPTDDPAFGVKADQFGFNITGSNDIAVVVEASDDLCLPIWLPVSTNTLAGGSSSFIDPNWTNHPSRVYRFRSP